MPRKAAVKAPKIQPDSVSLEIAFKKLKTIMTFEDVLKSRRLKRILVRMAVKHMEDRARLDVKKLQANDND